MAVVRASVNPNDTQDQVNAQEASRSVDLGDLLTRMSSQGSWSGDSREYLDGIRKILEDPSRPKKAVMTYLSDDAVAFGMEKEYVVLVRESGLVNVNALAADAKIYQARDAFFSAFPNGNLNNIVTVNKYMLDRPTQMASYINQYLTAKFDEAIKNFGVASFSSKYRLMVDTEMSNVRQFFDAHSPTPVICGDFGFVVSLVNNADSRFGQQQYSQGKEMFGVTGYVEFIQDERNNTFTPMVHVTDIVSVLASTKILALAIPMIGEVFITRGLWRHPFTTVGKTEINIGNLLIDQASQKPIEVKSDFDMRKLFREYINEPILCLDIKAGAPSVPGLNKFTRPSDHMALFNEIAEFLQTDIGPIPPTLSQNIFKEIVGVWDTTKHSKFSALVDTRDINYLYMVAKTKWSPQLEALKTRLEADPLKRWEYLSRLVGELSPTHNSITTVIYGDFIRSIGSILSNRIPVSMPSLTTMQSIDLGDIQAKAYHPGVPQFGASHNPGMTGGGFGF